MTVTVERTCTELRHDERGLRTLSPKPLSAYESRHSYVLLGNSGSGKTTAFRAECQRLGSKARFVSARHFQIYANANEPTIIKELEKKILFIDGLDEVRSGAKDIRSSVDLISSQLLKLSPPSFRISCREADWLGENDRNSLRLASNALGITTLRLDPLTQEDIERILTENLGVEEPRIFMDKARQLGIDNLLDNPQSLHMLAKAVHGESQWPKGRLETFQLACEQLALECNEDHIYSKSTRFSTERLIHYAGRLCAIQLISDQTGYSLDHIQPRKDYASLDEIADNDLSELQQAIGTRLFRADFEQMFSPTHRQVAEFLAAKYLATLIDEGLPVRRVLALMVGIDGIVASGLQGLSAWLAAHNPAVRYQLINSNPIGVAVYGDIRAFSANEKRMMLDVLTRHPNRLPKLVQYTDFFTPLVTVATQQQICQILRDPVQSDDRRAKIQFVLLVLSKSEPLPDLARDMLSIARDDLRSPSTRELALRAFIRAGQRHSQFIDTLECLLARIMEAGISTSTGELCGILLSRLYPTTVSPSKIWNYLTNRADNGTYGFYADFWRTKLLSKSSDSHLVDLLDGLTSDVSRLKRLSDLHEFRELSIRLLDRGLRVHGDRIERACIYRWLAVGAAAHDEFGSSDSPPSEYLAIRFWLEERPNIQTYIVEEGLQSYRDDEIFSCEVDIERRLYGARLPKHFGLWCLNEAVRIVASRPMMAKHLLRKAYFNYKIGPYSEGLSLQVLHRCVQESDVLSKLLDLLMSPPNVLSHEVPWLHKQSEFKARQGTQFAKYISQVRAAKHELSANRADPQLLHILACMYFGEFPYGEDNLRGQDAIVVAIGDTEASEAAIEGLCLSIERNDLPSVKEVLRLDKNRSTHHLCLPLLAAFKEREIQSPGSSLRVSNSVVRIGVACLHSSRASAMSHGDAAGCWYRQLLESKTKLVAGVAVQSAASAFRNRVTESPRLWEFLESGVCNDVALQATLTLLKGFPTRCDWSLLKTLDRLLWTAVRFGSTRELRALCGKKLSVVRIGIGERVRWLALGMICSIQDYQEELMTTVAGKERRARHLAQFLVSGSDSLDTSENFWQLFYQGLDSASLEVIVSCLGAYCFPPGQSEWVGVSLSDMYRFSTFIAGIIDIIANRPDKKSKAVLDLLIEDSKFGKLEKWHGELVIARDSQSTARREAEYCHPSISQVRETLRGNMTANPADLHALALYIIEHTAVQIRLSDESQWRQYWNLKGNLREVDPRPENACRDSLISSIRPGLPAKVTVYSEQIHVNDSRADIGFATDDFRIPVEIKKDSDSNLWIGLRKQLIDKYTIHPATGGYGIYVVFWFGDGRVKVNGDGILPESPSDLKRLLERSLTERESRKISICVIDVSRPGEHVD